MDKYDEQHTTLVAPITNETDPWPEVVRMGQIIINLETMLIEDRGEPVVPGSGHAFHTKHRGEIIKGYLALCATVWELLEDDI